MIPSSSNPAISAVASQPSRERRSPVSSGSATWRAVAWIDRPLARPARIRALRLQLPIALSTMFGLMASDVTTSRTLGT
jgi:hypothetical protein